MKFEYLKFKNEKSFQSEMKIFSFFSEVFSFRLTKQSSKVVVDPTFMKKNWLQRKNSKFSAADR